jgi:hypothetical protein
MGLEVGIRMRVIDAVVRMPGILRGVQKLRGSAGVTVFSDAEVSATHSTTHDDAAGHHHAGSPVRLQGGQRACVVSHDAIMTDCVDKRQIATIPRSQHDAM